MKRSVMSVNWSALLGATAETDMASNTSITDLAADMRHAERAAKDVIDELRRTQPDGNWFEYQMAVEDTARAGLDAVGNSIRQIERLMALAKSQQAPNA